MRRKLQMGLSVLLAAVLAGGCASAQPAKETTKTVQEAATVQTEQNTQEDIRIAYVCKDLSGDWFSTVFSSLEAVCKERGAKEVIGYNAGYDAAQQLQNLENAISQEVDFIIITPVDETMSRNMADMCEEAGIPYMADCDPLIENGVRIAPSFELDSYQTGFDLGKNFAQWAVDNEKLGDYSSTGLMLIDCTTVSSFVARPQGILEGWLDVIPDYPQDRIYRPDTDATLPEEGYDAAAAVVTAHPEIETWFLSGVNDECTTGAMRALEALGVSDTSYAACLGAYMAKDEWNKGDSWCVMGCWISAQKDGEIVGNAVMDYLQTGKEIFAEYKKEGEEFGKYPFVATYVDPSNYKEIMGDDAN